MWVFLSRRGQAHCGQFGYWWCYNLFIFNYRFICNAVRCCGWCKTPWGEMNQSFTINDYFKMLLAVVITPNVSIPNCILFNESCQIHRKILSNLAGICTAFSQLFRAFIACVLKLVRRVYLHQAVCADLVLGIICWPVPSRFHTAKSVSKTLLVYEG